MKSHRIVGLHFIFGLHAWGGMRVGVVVESLLPLENGFSRHQGKGNLVQQHCSLLT